jgi:hypothetical protein
MANRQSSGRSPNILYYGVCGIFGSALGFVTGAYSAIPLLRAEPDVRQGLVCGCLGGIAGSLIFLRVAQGPPRHVPFEIAAVVISFLSLTMVPWFQTPFGNWLPLGTAYVNPGFNVSFVLCAHLFLALLCTFLVTMLITLLQVLRML